MYEVRDRHREGRDVRAAQLKEDGEPHLAASLLGVHCDTRGWMLHANGRPTGR